MRACARAREGERTVKFTFSNTLVVCNTLQAHWCHGLLRAIPFVLRKQQTYLKKQRTFLRKHRTFLRKRRTFSPQ